MAITSGQFADRFSADNPASAVELEGGGMAYTFSQGDKDQIQALMDATYAGHWGDAYAKVVELATASGEDPDDSISLVWFRAAADINRGIGPFSDFIRAYTAAQYNIRFGTTL